MSENIDKSTPQQGDGFDESLDYLKRAAAADEAGDSLLSMYLYLVAFEQATVEGAAAGEDVINGLKQAWALACANKERSLAEYIFELLEPYLSNDEMELCASELQNLALDKLEEFGISRTELEDMASMISEDLLGMDEPIVKIEHITGPGHPIRLDLNKGIKALGAASKPNKTETKPNKTETNGVDSKNSESVDSSDENTKAFSPNVKSLLDRAAKTTAGSADASDDSQDDEEKAAAEYLEKAEADMQEFFGSEKPINYDSLAGYDSAVRTMRDLGIGMGQDEDFRNFVDMLNARHGLSQMPALDTIVFRSPAREDANRFMLATLGELSLPTVHMRMEENYQGMPVLCVSAHSVDIPKNNSLKDVFVNGGVLVLEDLDLWNSPVADMGDENNAFLMMQLTRGAREAVGLIGSAIDNPDVFVIVTASSRGSIDGFFSEMLGSVSIVDIDYPTPEERVQIWMDIAREHPSLRDINKADLVRLSSNMARYDIYMAAREAIEEAYKLGLMTRTFKPVTRDNIFDKLAAYQPLQSQEYSELENAVIDDFRADLDHIDDLLKDE